MPSVPRIDIRAQVIGVVILAIACTWLVSSGLEHYLTYRQILSFRATMVSRPDLYTKPIAEPQFGLAEFFLGYPQRLPAPDVAAAQKNQPPQPTAGQPNPSLALPLMDTQPREGPQPLAEEQISGQVHMLVYMALAALAIAVVFGVGSSLLFTRPLTSLMRAARAMGEGDYRHPVRVRAAGEFAELGRILSFLGNGVADRVEALERESHTRKQFLADMAHEFRTPLTTLKTMSGALEDGLADDPARSRRAIAAISRTSDRLLRLVTDMLELARLDLHELPLSLTDVDARELASTCRAARLEQGEAAGVTLTPVPPGPPFMALADPDRLAQILDNLLSNAISYAGRGAVVSFDFEEAGGMRRILLSDTGRGIAARHLPYLGEAFYRADATRTPGDEHSGLGLRIVRSLVSSQGGSFTLQSEEGKGTKVAIDLKKPSSEGAATES